MKMFNVEASPLADFWKKYKLSGISGKFKMKIETGCIETLNFDNILFGGVYEIYFAELEEDSSLESLTQEIKKDIEKIKDYEGDYTFSLILEHEENEYFFSIYVHNDKILLKEKQDEFETANAKNN